MNSQTPGTKLAIAADRVAAPTSPPLDAAELAARIEKAYQESGNKLGWRFLYSPAGVLNGAEVAFIGLNPGGNVRPPDHAEFAIPSGSAYCDEPWTNHAPGDSPLQRQVRGLFSLLGERPAEVLAGNFVSFRSPSWAQLHGPQAALSFARKLWADVFQACQPKLIVTMGTQVREEVARILGISGMDSHSTGWGSVSASRGSNGVTTLIGLPHLSRFRIIDRDKSGFTVPVAAA